MQELSIVQKTYDFIKWYVPILNCLPKAHKFILGERTVKGLYDLLEGLIRAKYSSQKLDQLAALNLQLDILRYQTRLLLDFNLIQVRRYEYASKCLDEIGVELGRWLKQQREREPEF
jgi:hypothetical protein